MSHSIITLTTDFGIGSPYVAQMKGVLFSLAPQVTVVDLTHAIGAQDISQAAWVLYETTPKFPSGSIHIAVVDPGVGTQREIVYAQIDDRHYIAPNNGLLGLLSLHNKPDRLIHINRSEYWRHPVSSTFHGRDIMAPVAAQLAGGLPPEMLGPPLERLVQLDWPAPQPGPQQVEGVVVAIDSFGNLMTNLAVSDLGPDASACRVRCGSAEVDCIVSTYGDRSDGELVALLGSEQRLEIAVVNGSAAQTLNIGVGELVSVRW